jgi:hypothetical protein
MNMRLSESVSTSSIGEAIKIAHERVTRALGELLQSVRAQRAQSIATALVAWVLGVSSANAQTTTSQQLSTIAGKPAVTVPWSNNSGIIGIGTTTVPSGNTPQGTPTIDLRSANSLSRLGEQEAILKDGSKITFAKIASMGTDEQEKIIEQVEWAKNRLRLTSYLLAIAQQEGNRLDTNIQAGISENIRLDREALAKMKVIISWWWKIKKEYESLVIKYATTPPPDENATYIYNEAKKRQIFA